MSKLICCLLVALLCLGCGRIDDPKPRLDKKHLQDWLASTFATGKPIRFFSSNGQRFCCEYQNVSVELLPNQTMHVEVDGWEPLQITEPYKIDEDGKITLLGDARTLKHDELAEVYVVRGGANIFMIKGARPGATDPVTTGLWPLSFIPNGEWRPPPKSASQ